MSPTDEEEMLRSVALQNARSILLARDRAEEALRNQTECLRITLASIGDAVISTDAEGRVTFLNAVAESLTGWSQAEAVGRPLPDVFHIVNEETGEPVENPAIRALDEGRIVGLANHTILIARDGSRLPIDDSAAPMLDGSGDPVGAVLVFRDVTERKRAEEITARLAAIVESSDDAIVSKTLDTIIRSWNAGAERLFGYTAEEAVGRPITLIIPEERRDEERAILDRLYRGERIEHFETVRVAKDGRKIDVSLTVSPVRDREGRIIGASKVARDITERKRAESERRRLEEVVEAERSTLVEVFHRAPSFLAILRGPEHVFELANDRYYQLIGSRDIIGKPVREALPEFESQGFFELLDVVYRSSEVYVGVDKRVLIQREPGRPLEERYLEFVYQPLRGQDGSVSGILAHGIDLTDRKRAEAAVRQRDERLRLFLDNATDYAVIITDAEGRILEWKGGAEQITGWPAEEILGLSADVIFTPEDRAAGVPEEERRKALANGKAEDKRWHLRKDGSRFFGDGVMMSLRAAVGELQGFGKVLRDVTERKRAEEALSRDALLLANVRDSVVVTDLEGVVTYWNEGATRLFGWTAEEMLGRHYADRFPEPVRSRIVEEIRSRAAGRDWSGEYQDFRKDGSSIWIDARVSRVSNAAGETVGLLGLAHDITDRKRAEEALRDADRRKDEFIALLAHELRNPLAPIRNGLQVMRLASDDANAVAQARGMMDRQLGHMVRLIDDLLDVSRISQNKMELRRSRVLVADIVANAVETARPVIEAAGHQLAISLPTSPIFLHADLTRLAQVFSNLLTNSAKYTRSPGRIWLNAERRDDVVVVSVRDTGIGIPAGSLRSVFDMFSQVDRNNEISSGGLGIGLALVKGLVEMHGGTVTAESEGRGRGSTFTVRLPAPATIDEPEAPAPRDDTRASRAPRRILVVDDNRDSARTMARVLTLLGDQVTTAHDGIEAVEAAEESRPDVILMDVGMPRMDGYEAARRIRNQAWGRSTIIVALTGWGQEGDRIQSRQAGCDGHLVKPVNLRDLEELLDELMITRQATDQPEGQSQS